MMRGAARHHAARGLLLAACLVVVLLLGREGYGRQRAQLLRDRLLEAATEEVPEIVAQMGPYRRWLDGPLRRAYADATAVRDGAGSCMPAWACSPSTGSRSATSSGGS